MGSGEGAMFNATVRCKVRNQKKPTEIESDALPCGDLRCFEVTMDRVYMDKPNLLLANQLQALYRSWISRSWLVKSPTLQKQINPEKSCITMSMSFPNRGAQIHAC